MKVDGLHHVTAITADIEANLNFYGRLLGLRLVWQGVNADDPEMRHVASRPWQPACWNDRQGDHVLTQPSQRPSRAQPRR